MHIKTRSEYLIRQAKNDDRAELLSFINSQEVFHRHFDWLAAIDWLGKQPFLIVEHQNKIISAIACPEYPDHYAWIRFFYFSQGSNPEDIFNILLQNILDHFSKLKRIIHPVTLSAQEWFTHILQLNNFHCHQQIVVLEWRDHAKILEPARVDHLCFRPITNNDLSIIQYIDHLAFPPIWQLPLESLQVAMHLNPYGTIVESHGIAVGYQISNVSLHNIHLSRLAVLPQYQHQSIGSRLLQDLKYEARLRDIPQITVNTQSDNIGSIALYKKSGFTYTGEKYPVFILDQ